MNNHDIDYVIDQINKNYHELSKNNFPFREARNLFNEFKMLRRDVDELAERHSQHISFCNLYDESSFLVRFKRIFKRNKIKIELELK